MKILLFGSNGQLGWELQRSLAPLGELIAPSVQNAAFCGDLTRPDSLRSTIRQLAPSVIVNAAAYTAVDDAETHPELADAINGVAPGILAEEAIALDAWLVHYSTDYVFNGDGAVPWRETDRPAPLNIYGRSKLRGEEAIQKKIGGKHLILRSSWLYSTRGKNFARTILHLARERGKLKVVDDQIGAPTGADLLADLTSHALERVLREPSLGGLYHVAAAGEISWYGYARYLLQCAHHNNMGIDVDADSIRQIGSAAYPTPARRPLNCRLDTSAFRSAFGLHLPHWQIGVQRLVDELTMMQNNGNP